MTSEAKHPQAIAIAKRGESCLWDMGDYLIAVAGKPGKYGDGEKVLEVSNELKEYGYPQYDKHYLMMLRQVAHDFPIGHRVSNVSWTAHQVAGTPEMLQSVIAAAKESGRDVSGYKKGEGISKRFVQQVIDGMYADRNAQRRGAASRARKIAEQAESDREKAASDKAAARRRQDDLAAKAAEKREQEAQAKAERHRGYARKLKGAPPRDKTKMVKPPKPEEVPMLVAKTKFAADLGEARALLRRMDKEITPHIEDLSKAFVVGSVEELLEIAESIRKLAAKLGRNQKAGSHLYVAASAS